MILIFDIDIDININIDIDTNINIKNNIKNNYIMTLMIVSEEEMNETKGLNLELNFEFFNS